MKPSFVAAGWSRARRRHRSSAFLIATLGVLPAASIVAGSAGITVLGDDTRGDCGAVADRDPRPLALFDSDDSRLEEAARHYRTLAAHGGWFPVAIGPVLRIGDRGPRVQALHTRLTALGDLNDSVGEPADTFGTDLERAVCDFQRRHGLLADGVVSGRTLIALNRSVEYRIRQIEANLARRRMASPMSGGEPRRQIVLNTPDFHLYLIEDGRLSRTMRAIVGRPDRPTPILSSRITHIVLSPSWHVPRDLAIEGQLPLLREDPTYARRVRMRIFDSSDPEAGDIEPEAVNWDAVSASRFPYRLVQEPGPANALGSAKFVFPNESGVLIHGTPDPGVFGRANQALSSGCVRIEDPLSLAETLLEDQDAWSRSRIDEVVAAGRETVVRLAEPVPVVLDYRTAWVDGAGMLQFRDDIYGLDTMTPIGTTDGCR